MGDGLGIEGVVGLGMICGWEIGDILSKICGVFGKFEGCKWVLGWGEVGV